MKVHLTKHGYIYITAEDVTEAWALNGVWPMGMTTVERKDNVDRFIIDCSVLDISEPCGSVKSSIPEFDGQTAEELTAGLTIKGKGNE